MSPFTVQPARSSHRSPAVMLPLTVPSTITERVLMSPLILACLPTVRRPCESICPSSSQSISSSFLNFTVPLIETPLDKVPPGLEVSGAPFPAGSGLAGGAGGVADIGIAGSTFRLLENICICLDLLRNDHGSLIHKGQPRVCGWNSNFAGRFCET